MSGIVIDLIYGFRCKMTTDLVVKENGVSTLWLAEWKVRLRDRKLINAPAPTNSRKFFFSSINSLQSGIYMPCLVNFVLHSRMPPKCDANRRLKSSCIQLLAVGFSILSLSSCETNILSSIYAPTSFPSLSDMICRQTSSAYHSIKGI